MYIYLDPNPDPNEPSPRRTWVDRPRLTLDESTRTLWNRAVSDPSSLTDQERRQISHRPPKEEEDTLCRNACGLSMDELIAKAINSNNSNNDNNEISYTEARLITMGVVDGETGRILNEVARLSDEDSHLKGEAMRAARTDDIRAARKAAKRVEERWRKWQSAARETLNWDDIRTFKYAAKIPWQEHVLHEVGSEGGHFGLVLFYEEKEAQEGGRLATFKIQIETAIFHALHWSPLLVKDETRERFALQWMAVAGSDNHDLDPSALRSRFSTMLSSSEVSVGFRCDAFLYVNEDAFCSRETARPYIWLAEPEPQSTPDTGAQPEVLPPLKVDIKHIVPSLFARLVQRDLQGKARYWPYRHTSELSRLHAAVNANHETDGIWPPPR